MALKVQKKNWKNQNFHQYSLLHFFFKPSKFPLTFFTKDFFSLSLFSISRAFSVLRVVIKIWKKMAGGGASTKASNGGPTRVRKRVEVESAASAASLKRAKDGSAFARWYELIFLI